jgi:CubicO group peptidase (beta-lactamase class C family)
MFVSRSLPSWRLWLAAALLAAFCITSIVPAQAADERAEVIVKLAREAMRKYDLKAVIVRVVVDGEEVVTEALGETMAGVPATKDMHFRNGAVAFAYITTLLLQMVDENKVTLDDKVSKWFPDLPNADRITLKMLANMTSGYPDYVLDEDMIADNYDDPFRIWTPHELIAFGVFKPLLFDPGTNWSYSHTGYVILGQVLQKISGKPLADLMQEKIFTPLKLDNTKASITAEIPAPVLHAFSSERRAALGVPADARFYEESTFWNPSWTTAPGAVQTTNIYDLTKSAEAIGTGKLLSPASHRAQVGPELMGFGSQTPECQTCRTLDEEHAYGLGVFLRGKWIVQPPLFGGYAATGAYHPEEKIAIGVVATFQEEAFDEKGAYKYGNVAETLFTAIGAYLAPDDEDAE